MCVVLVVLGLGIQNHYGLQKISLVWRSVQSAAADCQSVHYLCYCSQRMWHLCVRGGDWMWNELWIEVVYKHHWGWGNGKSYYSNFKWWKRKKIWSDSINTWTVEIQALGRRDWMKPISGVRKKQEEEENKAHLFARTEKIYNFFFGLLES